ncbi:MAG: DUF1282 family protein [Sphingomonadaceae bacterium]|nr:DUF1282 family protein [Sphingomonadaceae bacterium]
MNLVDRVQNILMTPRTEWKKIADETQSVRELFTGYAMILAAIPAVLGILLGFVFGRGYSGFDYLLMNAILNYAIGLAVLYVAGIAAAALAPSFDGQKDQIAGMKTVIYSCTAIWVATVFLVLPLLGPLILLAGFVYAAYLLYLGCQETLKIPENNAIGFTAVIIIGALVIGTVLGSLMSRIAWRMTADSLYNPGIF